ncbi:hydrogenase small subunit [Calderihabitans maritimus]|uniref:Ni,Fe-hydrogenase small subunit n=1 Tax=Calderihabitans maritimus TaxID=1246530 RepID=A0A1Z5HN30_9FIRM|nr:hydrogenase small subunit [Calderihabitans maritimus]GAW90923.1 Ni,Fe-hydrogenase small subunit [Calderihabitans maritimus]
MSSFKKREELVEEGFQRLEARGISRRTFIKLCAMTAAAFGLEVQLGPKMAEAAAENIGKKPLVWMQGQGCTGCSESLLSSFEPGPAEIILDMLSVRFHPTIMAASGEGAISAWKEAIEQGGYLLVLEGSIPTADPRFCMVEGRPLLDQFREAARKAEVVVAAGSCASYGGIPRAGKTGAVGAADVLEGQTVINLPSCPVKPTRLLGTVLYYLSFGEAPPLDEYNRPVPYYKRYLQHDSCPRRGHYERGEFLRDWNDPETVDWCLYYKGCKGPYTYTDCPRIWWNDGVNYCIRAGSPCAGCTQPEFYDQFTPLYAKQENFPNPGIAGLSPASLAKGIAGLTAVGVASHAVAKAVKNKSGGGEE